MPSVNDSQEHAANEPHASTSSMTGFHGEEQIDRFADEVSSYMTCSQRAFDLAKKIAECAVKMLDLQAQYQTVMPDEIDDDLVFVIASFAPEIEPTYLAIAAAARAVGLRAERIKDIQGDYRITDKMLAMIRHAKFIVADLTYERPNVYFELGYARAFGKTVITLMRSGAIAHFDVRDWPYLEYFDSRPLEVELLERFKFELEMS